MRIAHILPHAAKYPLETHHGRFEWVISLAKIQIKMGLNVTVFAHQDSNMDGIKFHKYKDFSYKKDYLNNLQIWNEALSGDFDIYHSHFDNLHYFFSSHTTKKIIFTQHWRLTEDTIKASSLNVGNVYALPITKFQEEENRRNNIKGLENIYHGIDLSDFKLNTERRSNRLVFIGRIGAHKGVKQAVEIAQKANVGLDIYGKVTNRDEEYFDSFKHMIDGKKIIFHGPVEHSKVPDIFGNAMAFLFPSQEVEAFGLVSAEAMATGTPVIATRINPLSEIIEDGKSGFLASTQNEFIEAIHKIGKIKHEDCREQAEKFDINKMVEEYTNLYTQLRQ